VTPKTLYVLKSAICNGGNHFNLILIMGRKSEVLTVFMSVNKFVSRSGYGHGKFYCHFYKGVIIYAI
jgi:hypothetical protein